MCDQRSAVSVSVSLGSWCQALILFVFRPHPHNLVGRSCKKGVCTVEINSSDMTETFNNLGIQCVKKKDIDEALSIREQQRVDPFRSNKVLVSTIESISNDSSFRKQQNSRTGLSRRRSI